MKIRLSWLFAVIILFFFNVHEGKSEPPGNNTGEYCYRIVFRDKGSISVSDFRPEQLLSPAAIDRREKCGTEALDFSDLPVNLTYINTVKQLGLSFHYSSKWMNSALFSSAIEFDINKITVLPFVTSVTIVKTPDGKAIRSIKKENKTETAGLAEVIKPINSINGIPLLLSGYRGKGVTIAVLDAGFLDADKIESLYALKARQGITRTYDYITGSNNVFGYSSHGTGVLSILAGNLPGVITGTAQDADYMLFRTEDSFSEYPVEEDFWVAAAEYADSAGADIITSSLGYYIFDNPEMDYAFSEADGNTAFITIAADRAASKGILVVCSAGNERDTEWQRICFPSDGDSVLCIGAVTAGGIISEFSSAGYSADERVKPDVVAQGVRVPLQYTSGSWLYGDGTSFSCPVISGMCASLMQAVPGATATEIADAVRRSADRYNNPDSLYGYGMPDFTKALEILYTEYAYKPEVKITAGPNPFTEEINIWFRESPESLSIIIADNSGKTVYRKDLITFIGRSYSVTGLSGLSPGIYVMKIKTSTEEAHFKLVKL